MSDKNLKMEGQELSFNLYDLNKNIINQLEPLTQEEINEKEDLINDFYIKSNNNHYMLLCKDFNYYTIFEKSPIYNTNTFFINLNEIINELGIVYSIESTEDNAIEIWIKPVDEENPYAFYLFPYDRGIVYYG